ncbi:hypothetical protein HYU92_06515 [Candidatus Curtissbacteria bacterium]|nr:hypothetical protein [Candidatus Curtissbacteria bacterium]
MKVVGIFNHLASIAIVVLAVVVIGYLNFALIAPWFSGDFNTNVASIEISYIQMAKFWVESDGASWQPLWYLGYPWHVFYTPLLPALEVLAGRLAGWNFAHAYRVVTGIGYILVPISTFFFVWQISKSKSGALVAALFYSFVPSLIAFLFPEVAADSLSGLPEPRRLAILVRWGEGPHTLALVFLPLFGVFLSRYLAASRFADLVLASVFLGLLALTNAIPLWAGLLLALSFLLGNLAGGKADFLSVAKRLLLVLALTLGLSAFWYNLPFIGTFFREGGGALNNWLAMFPWGLLVLGVGLVVIFIVVGKLFGKIPGLATAIFWFLMIFAIVYVYYASGENRLEYAPQALRLNTEADLALAVLVGVVISRLFLLLTQIGGYAKIIGWFAAFLVLGLPILMIAIWGARLLAVVPQYSRPLEQSKVGGVNQIAEYRVAKKLAELAGGSDQRVLAPGNYGFWLNFFEPLPQLRGGLFQSATHSWPEHIYWQVTNGADGAISLAWLKIANIGKLVYTTAGSAETYKDYKVPQEKFDKILKVNTVESGDVYFDVPLKNDALAKIVDFGALLAIKRPFNAIDSDPIISYVAQLEKYADRKLEVNQVKRDQWRISGQLENGQAVLFQMTYDPGWRVKSRPPTGNWRVARDSFDFMVLAPKQAGRFEIDLVYGRPFSVWLGYLVTAATLAFIGYRTYRIYES